MAACVLLLVAGVGGFLRRSAAARGRVVVRGAAAAAVADGGGGGGGGEAQASVRRQARTKPTANASRRTGLILGLVCPVDGWASCFLLL